MSISRITSGVVAGLMSAVLLSIPASADEARVMTIVKEKCSLCHGEKGDASSSIYPRLAGQHQVYLGKQLRNFRDGVRKSDTMKLMAAELTDEEIAGLAAYFAAQPAEAHHISRPNVSLEAVGYYIYHKGNKWSEIPACASCHGETAEGTEQLPRLAGQHKEYVASQLKAFNERIRTNDNAVMHTIASKLTELEVNAVALYVSGIKPEETP